MKRIGFRAGAIAIALVVVFAPGPSGRDASKGPDRSSEPLIGRALAPTIDAGDVREQETSRMTRAPIRALWAVCLLVLIALGVRRRVFLLVDPPRRRRSAIAVSTNGCRAPPVLA